MRGIDRRKFINYCLGSATMLGLDQTVLGRLREARAGDLESLPTVVWLAAANCTGCTMSLANLEGSSAPGDIGELLLDVIDLEYHPNLMGAAGDLAVATLHGAISGDYVLVVEGGIPTAFGGNTCMLWTESGHDVTAQEAVAALAPGALAVLAVGTCASFGGIPGATPNPTDVISVYDLTGLPVINIPGCPAHPDWVVSTIAQLLAGSYPQLDQDRRPTAFFGSRIHSNCPFEDAPEAHSFGQLNHCLEELGCKGERTRADCHQRRWHGGTTWCMGAGSVCIGCTERIFPDGMSPFYGEDDD